MAGCESSRFLIKNQASTEPNPHLAKRLAKIDG